MFSLWCPIPGFEVPRLRVGQSLVRIPAWTRHSSLHKISKPPPSVQPASYPMHFGGSFPGVRRLEGETHHSPPYSAEVRMNGDTPPLSQWGGQRQLCLYICLTLDWNLSVHSRNKQSYRITTYCSWCSVVYVNTNDAGTYTAKSG